MQFQLDALKGRLEKISELRKIIPNDKFLIISFEELASGYDNSKSIIEEFLGIDRLHHKLPGKYYNPDTALRNSVGMYKNYLTEEDLKDIKKIEMLYDQIKNKIS